MQDPNELEVFTESLEIAVEVYRLTEKLAEHRRFRLANQLEGSSLSVPSNIAEGCGRQSSKEMARFLDYAISSAFELSIQLRFVERLNLADTKDLVERCTVVAKRMVALLKCVKTKN